MNCVYRYLTSALVPLVFLTACSSAPVNHVAALQCPPSPNEELDAAQMLGYRSCISAIAPAALAREYDIVGRHFAQTGSGADRVKLALLLAVPDTSIHNVPLAQRLLSEPGAQGAVPRKLDDLAQMLRDSFARQIAVDGQLQDLKKELTTEKAHAEMLQNKIDSIKDLERNLLQQGRP